MMVEQACFFAHPLQYFYHLQDDVEGRFNRLVEDLQKMVDAHLGCFGCGQYTQTG